MHHYTTLRPCQAEKWACFQQMKLIIRAQEALGTFPFHIFQNNFLPVSILASLLESFKFLHSSLLAFLSIDRHMCTYTSGIFQGLPCYCPKQGTCQSSCISLQRFLSNQSVRFNPHSSTKNAPKEISGLLLMMCQTTFAWSWELERGSNYFISSFSETKNKNSRKIFLQPFLVKFHQRKQIPFIV